MSNEDFNALFAKRLKFYMEAYGLNQIELARRLGVGKTTVSNWYNGQKTPRMDKIDAMCQLFHCSRTDLIKDSPDQEAYYYINPKTAEVANELLHNEELSILFEAARDASPEDLRAVHDLLVLLKNKGGNVQ